MSPFSIQARNLPPVFSPAGLVLLFLVLQLSAGGAAISTTNIATLEFRSADRIWDATHRVVLLCDPAGHRVVSLATNGRIQAVWQAAESQFPEALALSPDGRKIAVTLPVRPHSDSWFEGQTGGIAVLDAETLTAERTLTIDLDPWDVALLDEGHLLVSGGSGQFTTVNLYPPGASSPSGSQGVRQRSYLMPSRDGRRVYLADTDVGPASLRRLDLNPASLASPLSDPGRNYFGSISARSRPQARPDDALVILNGGDAVGVSASSDGDLVRLGGLSADPLVFTGVVWDAARKMMLVCTDSPEPALMAFHSESLLPFSVSTTDRAVDALFVDGDTLYGTVREAERTTWVQLPHPALGAETNRTPTAAFTESPNPSVDAPVVFHSGSSTDDRGVSELAFAWDFNGDGLADAPYASGVETAHSFSDPGTHPVTLFVRDFWGATNSVTRLVSVGPTTNRPPVAAFSWLPGTVETGVPVTFDASASSDDQPPGIPLAFQWDWDGDGAYDTPESTAPRATHLFQVSGRFRVALLVRDQRGATNRLEREIDVATRPDPGWPLSGQPALDLPFAASAMWVDSSRGYAYFTDPVGKRLLRMPLPSGIPDREWRFEFPADALAASTDGRTLYVSELVIPRSSFNFGRQAGLIGVLDVPSGVLLRKFSTDVDPAQLLAIGDGRLLVGGGSAQLTQLKSYDTSDGRVLGMGEVRENSAMVPRGPERALALTTYGSGAEVTQFRMGSDGTLSQEQEASTLLPEPVWAPWTMSPDGRSILSGNGYRLSVPADPLMPVAFEGRLSGNPGDDSLGAAAFDLAERKAAFRGTRNRVDWYETASWSRIRSFETIPEVRFLGLWSDRLVVAGNGGRGTRVQLLRNPAAGAETNQAPVVNLSATGDPFSTAAAVDLDASATTDDRTPPGQLEFRWDWTGDGVFDTEFSAAPKASHRYFIAGRQVARVQARDAFGATASGTVAFTVVAAADPGFAGRTNTPFLLPFRAAGVAFDGPRRRAFVSDAQAREVVAVDLDTGLELRRWVVPGIPERMATTPNFRRLYVVLPGGQHQYSASVPNGHVVEFDLEAMTMTRLIPVETDPWDVAATDEGILVVSSGSNQFAPLDAYRAADGVRTSRIIARFRSRLMLDPDQAVVWALTTDSSPQSSVRLDLNPSLGTFGVGLETLGEPLGPTIVAPLGGNRTLDARGRLLATSNPLQVLSAPSDAPAVLEGALLAGGSWIVATTPTGVRYLAPGDAAWLPWAGTPPGNAWIGPVGDRHGLATLGTASTEFTLRSLPAQDASSNQPPVVTWAQSVPEGIAVPGSVELRARMEDRDGAVVSAELWSGDTKVTDMLPASPFFFASIGTPGTNRFRIIARDNLGVQSTSAERIVIGRSPPSVAWLEPSFPVVEPGTAFALEVAVTPGDGPVSRVEFTPYEGDHSRPTLTATAPPWRVTLPGILEDARIVAVAYDDLGIASRETVLEVHAIGEEGDDFYRPFVLEGSKPFDVRSNAFATRQGFEPVDPQNPFAGRSLWWRWTAPSNGIVAVSTAGSTLDTYLAVFSGSRLNALRSEGANQDAPGASPFSLVKLRVTQGTSYFIFVDSPFSLTGAVALSVGYERVSPNSPPNDLFANRTLISSVPARFEVETTGATVENLEPIIAGKPGGHSVWWEWVATASGRVEVSTEDSSFDTLLGVFSSFSPSPSPTLIALASNDDASPDERTSRVQARVSSGQRLFLVVDGFAGASGRAVLSLTFTPTPDLQPPPNDAFTNATRITGETVRQSGTLVGSTREPEESLPFTQGSVWWRWTAPRSAVVWLTVEPVVPQPGGGILTPTVWTGSSLSNLVAEPPASGTRVPGRMVFNAAAGQTYHLRFASSSKTADFTFTLNATQTPVADGLISLSRSPEGGLSLRFLGPAPIDATLQKSPDLLNWTEEVRRTWVPDEDYALPEPIEAGAYLRILIRP